MDCQEKMWRHAFDEDADWEKWLELMRGHNEIIGKDPDELRLFVDTRYNCVLDPLVMWESCDEIVRWLDEMESADSAEWQEIGKDGHSLAQVRAWRSYLREIAPTGARALFMYPPDLAAPASRL